MKLVVLEDDATIARWAVPALGYVLPAGWEVVPVVSRFQELYDPAKWKDVAVLLTDFMVPNFDVADFCRWLKGHYPDLRIVVFSAMTNGDLASVDGVIDQAVPKPANLETLAKAVLHQ